MAMESVPQRGSVWLSVLKTRKARATRYRVVVLTTSPSEFFSMTN